MSNVTFEAISVDTINLGDPDPLWGRVSAAVNGTKITLTLNKDQKDRVAALGLEIASELLGSIATAA